MYYDCKQAVKSDDKTYLCNKQSCRSIKNLASDIETMLTDIGNKNL